MEGIHDGSRVFCRPLSCGEDEVEVVAVNGVLNRYERHESGENRC